MHSSKSIFYFLSWLLIVQSSPLEDVEGEKVAEVDGDERGVPIPLYRYYNADIGDHFYTTNVLELGPSGKNGYVSEGITGRCYPGHHKNTVAFLRYYNRGTGDHFYTTNFGELGCGRNGYVSEGIACYVFVQSNPGTVPLYRYYNRANGDHFYTTNWSELGSGKDGYISEGIAAYILPI